MTEIVRRSLNLLWLFSPNTCAGSAISTFIEEVMRDSVRGVRRSLRLLTSFIVVRILTQSQHHIDTPCSQSRSRETETHEVKHKMLEYDRSTETSIGFQCYCALLRVTGAACTTRVGVRIREQSSREQSLKGDIKTSTLPYQTSYSGTSLIIRLRSSGKPSVEHTQNQQCTSCTITPIESHLEKLLRCHDSTNIVIVV